MQHADWYRVSSRLRWFSVAIIGLVGTYLLFDSAHAVGLAMDWRISAGVAAITFACFGLLESIGFPRGSSGFKIRSRVALFLSLAGTLLLLLLNMNQWSDWAKGVLLELAISCIFVAAIEYHIGGLLAYREDLEREERLSFDEVALGLGYYLNLSLWQYKAMRQFIDFGMENGAVRTFTQRQALLFKAADKAHKLPKRLDAPSDPQFAQEFYPIWIVTKYCSDVATEFELSDREHIYLANVTSARVEAGNLPVSPSELLADTIADSADLIIMRRRRGLGRLVFWRRWDPLDAHEELEKYYSRPIPSRRWAFSIEETSLEE